MQNVIVLSFALHSCCQFFLLHINAFGLTFDTSIFRYRLHAIPKPYAVFSTWETRHLVLSPCSGGGGGGAVGGVGVGVIWGGGGGAE